MQDDHPPRYRDIDDRRPTQPIAQDPHHLPQTPGAEAALERLRAICLVFPEAVETGGVGNPSFKVREKIFAMRHGHEGRASVWFKAPPGAQGVLVRSESGRFFVPPYVGHRGWVGMWLDGTPDWELLADLIDESYRMTAPKRLVALLEAR